MTPAEGREVITALLAPVAADLVPPADDSVLLLIGDRFAGGGVIEWKYTIGHITFADLARCSGNSADELRRRALATKELPIYVSLFEGKDFSELASVGVRQLVNHLAPGGAA